MTRGQRTGKVLLLFTILLLLLGSIAIQAQEPIERQLIRLQVATFDPLVDGEPVVNLEVQSPQKGGPYYLVQFADSIDAVSVQQVEQLGAELLGYVPDNTHLARIRAEDVDKIRSLSAVRWVGPYRSDYKLAPGLSTSRMGVADTQIEVYVVGFPGESLADLESFLRGWGATVEDTAKSEIGIFFRIRIAASALPAIVQHPAISWVEPFTPIQTANQEGRRVINVENVWQNNGYFGNGQIVAVSDSGLSDQNSLSLDFG